MNKLHHYLLSLLFFLAAYCSATEKQLAPENGKFSIGRDTITSFGYASYFTGFPCFIGDHATRIFCLHGFSYGITPKVGCTFTIPFIVNQRIDDLKSRGLWDLRFNLQWHLYRNDDNILVLKTGMWFPTGDINAKPPLSFGSFNPTVYLIGVHSSERLFANFVLGGIITNSYKHRNTGSLIDYQFHIGPKFPLRSIDHGNLYTFLELQGYYRFQAKYRGERIPDTGWHILLLGPTIAFDNDWYQVKAQISAPIIDKRNGIQPSTNFFASLWYGVRF